MEFVMSTDLNTALPKEIGFNFEELKAELSERLEYYNGLAVTEDTVNEGKAERAKLNKLREAVEAKRKEVKRECMAPYTDFEHKIKELVAIIDAPIAAIDSQIKAFEDLRRETKRAEIQSAYEAIVPEEQRDIIPLERIFDLKWLNATVKMKAVEEALAEIVRRTDSDLLVLDTVEPEFAAAVRTRYAETLDIGAALRYQQALRDAEEAARRRAADTAQAPVRPSATVNAPAAEPAHYQEKLYLLRLELYLTQPQATALKKFLVANGIDYEKI